MSTTAGERTYQTYQKGSIVDFYDELRDIQPAERTVFDGYVPAGKRVLDIGVGAGRTTRYLAPRASKYVAIDYAESMVVRCKERFPELEFHTMDAADMSHFAGASFDVVVFSLNGLGTLPTHESRARCIAECARVLVPRGRFVFSLHNPRFVVFKPQLGGVGLLKKGWRLTYAAMQTLKNVRHRLPSRAFREGSGYVTDPGQHDALTIYTCAPDKVREEVGRAGFEVLTTLTAPDEGTPSVMTPYYYYACEKR
jgi:SAM-dependent methyltransferase